MIMFCGVFLKSTVGALFLLVLQIVRNPMVEKPNKDGKPPTVEYQEEEVLVSLKYNNIS